MIRDPWVSEPDSAAMYEVLSGLDADDHRTATPARQLAEQLFGDLTKANIISLGSGNQPQAAPRNVV